jgi:hypothetical protein
LALGTQRLKLLFCFCTTPCVQGFNMDFFQILLRWHFWNPLAEKPLRKRKNAANKIRAPFLRLLKFKMHDARRTACGLWIRTSFARIIFFCRPLGGPSPPPPPPGCSTTCGGGRLAKRWEASGDAPCG